MSDITDLAISIQKLPESPNIYRTKPEHGALWFRYPGFSAL